VRNYVPKTNNNTGTYTPPKTYDKEKTNENKPPEKKGREYKRDETKQKDNTIKKEPKKEGEN
jgi:hypothetical protein